MPSAPFPEQVDANRLFAREGEISAVLSLSRLTRFRDCLAEPEGRVSVALSFEHDEEGRRRLRGKLSSEVFLQCQRCLQALPYALRCELDLLVVADDAAAQQVHQADTLQTDVIVEHEEGLDVLAVIEDELILSLPLVPAHENEACSQVLNALQAAETTARESAVPGGDKSSPFAVLAQLKSGSRQQGNGE